MFVFIFLQETNLEHDSILIWDRLGFLCGGYIERDIILGTGQSSSGHSNNERTSNTAHVEKPYAGLMSDDCGQNEQNSSGEFCHISICGMWVALFTIQAESSL